ncbi:DUF4246 domain-containing protein [Nocardia sp. AG03]|uniref:DUF4246 domain-containing protein n=1 Tax=Nocardia sp. AG03 TaxID=3025312 RepID=UPI00241870E4|nr:DUF4246 domain-containing protein [Nocardia sp. AG03]
MTDLSAFPLPFFLAYKRAVAPVRTLREVQMTRLSAALRAKPRWFVKRDDPTIVDKWTREAAEQGLTDAQIRYVLDELAYYAARRDERTGIEVSGIDGVWHSDSLIEDELRARLAEAVRPLEEVPEAERDWHPGSDGQVLDLVHPSLFCYVRGVSLPADAPWPTTERGLARSALSERFQWLPTDVAVDADGGVEFVSYVNNVDPAAHRDLAAVLPVLFARMRPLFENVLTDLRHPRPLRIEADPYNWYTDEPVEPDDEASDEDWEAYEEASDDWWRNRRPVVPDAPEYRAPQPITDETRVDLRGRRLQVIVKLATIQLTPDKPAYPGGSWHVEGMMNERIVSTGIYYWDSDNITDSQLGFRAAVDDPRYEQNDSSGMRDVYGLADEDQLNQYLGAVETSPGRCLAFPNVLQHRVAPFQLADPTRPGHRKILAFFLIDPSVTITSTADIPPQQPGSPTSTMTRAEAERYREELMKERTYFVDEHNEELYEREFSLCEH